MRHRLVSVAHWAAGIGIAVMTMAGIRGVPHALNWLSVDDGRYLERILGPTSPLHFVLAYASVAAWTAPISEFILVIIAAIICRTWGIRTPSGAFGTTCVLALWTFWAQSLAGWPPPPPPLFLHVHSYILAPLVLCAPAVAAFHLKKNHRLSRVDLLVAIAFAAPIFYITLHVLRGRAKLDAALTFLTILGTCMLASRLRRGRSMIPPWCAVTWRRAESVCLRIAGASLALAAVIMIMLPDAPLVTTAGIAKDYPHVIVLTFDALRADALSCYGGKDIATPSFDALAQQGVLFRKAWSATTWTRPSIASLMTGLYPSAHSAWPRQAILPDDVWYLPEHLHKEGYATAGFMSNPHASRQWGFGRGYDLYDDGLGRTPLRVSLQLQRRFSCGLMLADLAWFTLQRRIGWRAEPPIGQSFEGMSEKAIAWISQHRDRPCFVYVHALETHQPFGRNEPFPDLIDLFVHSKEIWTSRALYLKQAQNIDASLGRFLARLNQLDPKRRMIVIVSADHGEITGEGGFLGHGRGKLTDQELSVPLIFFDTAHAWDGLVCDDPASLVDIPATILSLVGIPTQAPTQGVPLLGDSRYPRQAVFAELDLGLPSKVSQRYRAVCDGTWKLVRDEEPPEKMRTVHLYNMAADVLEQRDLSSAEPEILRRLNELLDDHERDSEGRRVKGLSYHSLPESVRRQMAFFGYFE